MSTVSLAELFTERSSSPLIIVIAIATIWHFPLGSLSHKLMKVLARLVYPKPYSAGNFII